MESFKVIDYHDSANAESRNDEMVSGIKAITPPKGAIFIVLNYSTSASMTSSSFLFCAPPPCAFSSFLYIASASL